MKKKKGPKTREDEYAIGTTKDEEEEGTYFHDNADIVRHTTKIHSKDSGMSEDYPLCKPDERTKKFMLKSHTIADTLESYIADPEIAKETARIVRRESNNIAILERNKPENWLLRKIFGRTYIDELDKEEEEQQQGLVAGIMNGIFGKKRRDTERKYE